MPLEGACIVPTKSRERIARMACGRTDGNLRPRHSLLRTCAAQCDRGARRFRRSLGGLGSPLSVLEPRQWSGWRRVAAGGSAARGGDEGPGWPLCHPATSSRPTRRLPAASPPPARQAPVSPGDPRRPGRRLIWSSRPPATPGLRQPAPRGLRRRAVTLTGTG